MNYDNPELLDRLAAEYVFGSLSSRARRRFERLRRQLPAADAAAREWETQLASLSRSVPVEQPPSRVWTAIDGRTGGRDVSESQRRWTWLRPAWGFAFGVLATFSVFRLFPDIMPIDAVVQQRETLPQSYVGLLTDDRGNAVLLASSTRYGRLLSIKWLRSVDVPQGRVPVLWALPRQGAPFVVGVAPAGATVPLRLTDTSEKLFSDVQRLAVSFEPGAPQPGATPSSFVLSGHCVKLW